MVAGGQRPRARPRQPRISLNQAIFCGKSRQAADERPLRHTRASLGGAQPPAAVAAAKFRGAPGAEAVEAGCRGRRRSYHSTGSRGPPSHSPSAHQYLHGSAPVPLHRLHRLLRIQSLSFILGSDTPSITLSLPAAAGGAPRGRGGGGNGRREHHGRTCTQGSHSFEPRFLRSAMSSPACCARHAASRTRPSPAPTLPPAPQPGLPGRLTCVPHLVHPHSLLVLHDARALTAAGSGRGGENPTRRHKLAVSHGSICLSSLFAPWVLGTAYSTPSPACCSFESSCPLTTRGRSPCRCHGSAHSTSRHAPRAARPPAVVPGTRAGGAGRRGAPASRGGRRRRGEGAHAGAGAVFFQPAPTFFSSFSASLDMLSRLVTLLPLGLGACGGRGGVQGEGLRAQPRGNVWQRRRRGWATEGLERRAAGRASGRCRQRSRARPAAGERKRTRARSAGRDAHGNPTRRRQRRRPTPRTPEPPHLFILLGVRDLGGLGWRQDHQAPGQGGLLAWGWRRHQLPGARAAKRQHVVTASWGG